MSEGRQLPFDEAVAERLTRFEAEGIPARIWAHDPTVWADPDTPELADRLGWLTLPTDMVPHLERLDVFAQEARAFDHVALIGMGGSSLAPEVFQSVFGNAPGQPALTVLDSTHPRAVLDAEERLDLDRTLFVVSSKSGSTLETMSLYRYFWYRTGEAAERFVAITDPGSSLHYLAEERAFRHTFGTPPDVGGRYSALTFFGLAPAAAIGVDVPGLLAGAAAMAEECGPGTSAHQHPGMRLGAWMGEAARRGRDKLTLLTSHAYRALPDWIEQLVAESTGKDGVGIVPITHEPEPASFGDDRSFLGYGSVDVPAGAPAVLRHDDPGALGAEMYLAEFAVAVAGAVLGIQPFDQPNVEAAKNFARDAMAHPELETAGGAMAILPIDTAADQLDVLLSGARTDDYVAVQAFLPPSDAIAQQVQGLRQRIGARGMATTSGVGPRYLHSTGQLHKGGADNGIFVQLVDADRPDVAVPETDYGFGDILDAQAFGDAQALAEQGRRLVRVLVTEPADIDRLIP